MFKRKWLVLVSLLIALVGCSGGSENKDTSLVSISVTPATASIALDTDLQFVATGIYSDNTTKDLTAAVDWHSSDAAVAVIASPGAPISQTAGFLSSASAANPGHAYGTGEGTATITATYGQVSGSSDLKVRRSALVSISISPTNPSIAKGTGQQFTATGTFDDAATQDLTMLVKWTSSNTSAATISNTAGSQGLATSTAAGVSTITAAWGSVAGSTALTVKQATLVSISITPTNPAIAKGMNQQFTATGTYSDNTTQNLTNSVAWSSSNTAVATISNSAGSNGLSSALAAGSTTITAASGSISGATNMTVNPATLVSIAIAPIDSGIAKGTKQQFTATGTYSDNSTQNITASVIWTSSNASVATISNAAGSNGLATSVAAGSTTIKATSGTVSASTSLTVNSASLLSLAITPAGPSVARGTTQQFTAMGTYSDNTTQDLTKTVTWSSSNTAVSTISNAAGSNGLAATIATGTTTIKAVSGSISGSTQLTVTQASLVSIKVTPASATTGKGSTRQFTATGTYSDGSTQILTNSVTWSSSNTAVATISNAAGSNGLATGIETGTTTIKAVTGSISGTAALTVADQSVSLAWDEPTTNTDGSSLTDLAGYKIHYGTSPGNYTTSISIGNTTSYVISNLNSGTYYFAVTSVNASGVESAYSGEVYKIIP